MKYEELKSGIRDHLNSAAEDFFTIGYYLRQISEQALFIEDGYKSIWEFAKGEYGLSTSSASRFMAINERFTIDGGQHMDQKYIGMGPSKLQEMLGLSDKDLEKVTKETTVKELRAMKAAKLSFYKLPKTVREEGSPLETKGCGNGKHDCFLCSRPCGIRQEERLCHYSTIQEGRPCSRVNEEAFKDMEAGMHSDECLFLHMDELASKTKGSGEPTPCCKDCEHKESCYSCCDVARKEVEAERAKRLKERQVKKEEKKEPIELPYPSKKDYEAFYKNEHLELYSEITAAGLKERYKNRGGANNKFSFRGLTKEITINDSLPVTWAKLAKELNIIKAERAETEKENDKKIKQKQLEDNEDIFIETFIKHLYPGNKNTIKEGNKAAITKELKKEYGETFDGGSMDEVVWNCYPDKITFSFKAFGQALQITWGKFTSKILAYIDKHPEALEEKKKEEPEKIEEPDIIDAEFAEITDAEEQEELPEEDPEMEIYMMPYKIEDVEDLLDSHQRDLNSFIDIKAKGQVFPERLLKKQVIIVDALKMLFERMKEVEN